MKFASAYAYSPRENVGSRGGNHLTVTEPLHRGRLRREAGDPLCKPYRKFWGLHDHGQDRLGKIDCARCLEILAGFPLEEREPVMAAIRLEIEGLERLVASDPEARLYRRWLKLYQDRLALLEKGGEGK